MSKAKDEIGMKVHPDAALFPMMSDEELDALAADIKENGQLHAVTVDEEGRLVDGRNRAVGCSRAGIEPRIEKLNGHDPKAFILSANINRRHMTAGQRAMATAMIYPEPEKGGRGKKSAVNPLGAKQFSAERLSLARAVLRQSRPLAEAVMAGSKTLDEAHAEIKQQEAALQSNEARLERLRTRAPDLAELVTEERLTVAAAEAEIAERARMDREARDNGRKSGEALQTEIIGHVAAVMAAMQLGETKLFERKKINAAIEALQTMLGGKS